ncbi:phytochrome A-associated F-box protein [Dioscorea cayenensis subsp. rotundata]|uniref:Phytochrome A-associated F-box protein n=1 Tax=Dioscorea cayennensis subsp. rotundata TaxID=55577 RepID=A0AB40CAJ7_DIOCR|nr:phytochrome A-associated F-box protein [Dioscorea cayenensis subsp. rotundata]
MSQTSSSSSSSSPAMESFGAFVVLSEDLVLKILAKLEADPRDWARISCVSSRFSTLVSNVCCRSKCTRSIPSVVSDLVPLSPSSPDPPGGWASLHKLSVCCPGLLHAGVLLEHSDFGLELEIGPDLPFLPRNKPQAPPLPSDPSSASSSWSLFDDLYLDTVYDVSESQIPPAPQPPADAVVQAPCRKRKRQLSGHVDSHLASGVWNLSREQGNKLLASRFRGDCLYICDWPGCLHVEEKRNYMLFRGVFKDFKRSRVWRTINDGNRSKIDLCCAFCACKETWDLHSAFCLRRVFGFHDDGEPVVRAYVCENGHVSGAWTERPMYT